MRKYYVNVQNWDKKKKEYVGRCVYESRNRERARKMFEQMQVDEDKPMIELYFEDSEQDIDVRLDHKVLLKGFHVSE